jgi:hypothetical protein
MRVFASSVGADNAATIVAALGKAPTDRSIDEEIASDFFAEYATRFPTQLERAILPMLESNPTPLAILTAGHAKANSAVPVIRAIALAPDADEEILFASIDALGDIATESAAAALDAIAARADLSDEVREEISITRNNMTKQ